jgi:hypothetical protein
MNDIEAIIEVMQEKLLHKLGEEVDLIFLYGSYLKGATHQYSDVDLSFVPVHEKTWDSITVMVDDKLFDFYPMHWSTLERMADFQNVSSSVLFENRIIYQRSEESAARFHALAERLRTLMQPEARPRMVRAAQEIFQGTAYPYYLLRQEAMAGHQLGCLQQVQTIFRMVLHSLAVCNQACVDTRKLAQVLALPRLPARFLETAHCVTTFTDPVELLAATEILLQTTRDLLLAEQRGIISQEETFASVFNSAYPELKRDIQAILLGCQRQNQMEIRGSLVSLYHELSCGMRLVYNRAEYTGFNSLSEYEQDLAAAGFPPLLPALVAKDFDQLYQQCLKFDQRLKEFLSEQSVALNNFAGIAELKNYLDTI